MLETIREFAAEQLEDLPDVGELRDRHAAWYVALGERARPELEARRGPEWLDRLDAEQANLRATLESLLACEDKVRALQLADAIWLFWAQRGHWTEGRRFVTSALALGGDVDPELLLGGYWGAAILALWQGDVDEGEEWATRALELARDSGSARAEALAVHTLATAADERGDRDRAYALYEESLVLARAVDNDWLLSAALNNLGALYMSDEDYERAIELFEESLAIGEARGDLDRRARELTHLGWATHALGDGARAHDFFRSGLAAAEQIGLVVIELSAMSGIAACQADAGDAVTAARLLGCVKEEAARLGSPRDATDTALEERLREILGPKRLSSELAVGAALAREDAIDLAFGRKSITPG